MADVVLDYNQIIEETPVTGDSVPPSGGLITFQFKCDVNGATDLSNTFFAADVEVKSVSSANAKQSIYIPDAYDFHAFPMLRCFQSITHIIDGQTVCNSQHPYADALIVEKFLTTHSKANIENFQALSLMKQIDNGMKEYNLFTFDKPASVLPQQQKGGLQAWIYDWAKPGLFRSKYSKNGSAAYPAQTSRFGDDHGAIENVSDTVVTMLFQPPFDLWRLRQPFHGGIHQIQLNLRPREDNVYWGGYMTTSCVGLCAKGSLIYDMPRGLSSASGTVFSAQSFMPLPGIPLDVDGANIDLDLASPFVLTDGSDSGNNFIKRVIAAAQKVDQVFVDIKRLRLLRRVIRTSVPPQLSNVQYNFTEISMQHGTPSSGSMSQQFLLPSTTFGLIFYWRESTNNFYDQVGVHPEIQKISKSGIADATFYSQTNVRAPARGSANGDATSSLSNITADVALHDMYRVNNLDMDLHDFQFTYGGATYPMQRIQRITGDKNHDSTDHPYGWHRLMTLQNQLQGVYNSTMDDFPNSYGHGYGKGVLNRMDPHMMFFPVSRTGNSDNGILQVEYTVKTRKPSNTALNTADESKQVQLVVVALYDAQLNMQYSSNELQQIVLTQFK
tara:strand:+ start:382 stop:2220 length:1839 start_codon:yes stop_codon:yes gene_type:complete